MRSNRAICHFAEALWLVTDNTKATTEVKTSLSLLQSLIKTEPAFKAFVSTTKISTDDKMQILKEMFQGQINIIILELFKLMDESRQSHLFVKVLNEYFRLDKERSNRISVSVFTHSALDEKEAQSICDQLETVTGKTVEFSSKVDKSIIGGIKMRIGNTLLDGSLATQMKKLKRNLIN